MAIIRTRESDFMKELIIVVFTMAVFTEHDLRSQRFIMFILRFLLSDRVALIDKVVFKN
jgi:hypothetical protein